MSKINLKNYEAYFLDFSEGSLSNTEQQDLRDFLTKHPQLKEELVKFEQPLLTANHSYNQSLKNQLLREETTGLPLLDYLMVAQVEETISSSEKRKLSEMVNTNEALLSDLAVYHKTKLTADETIYYSNKEALLKKDNRFAFWAKSISTVAAAALILSLLNLDFVDKKYHPIQFSYSAIQLDDQKTESVQQQVISQKRNRQNSPVKVTKSVKPAENIKSNRSINRIKISKIQSLASHPITSSNSSTEKMENNLKEIKTILPTTSDIELLAQNNKSTANSQFLTLPELAAQKIKTDVLKNKSLKDNLLEELADLSNNRLSLSEKQDGESQRFAINLGKFSYSNF